jgi:hypothetical protein
VQARGIKEQFDTVHTCRCAEHHAKAIALPATKSSKQFHIACLLSHRMQQADSLASALATLKAEDRQRLDALQQLRQLDKLRPRPSMR